MLAIASLATGFVVAAITPSHALTGQDLGGAKDLRPIDLHGMVEGVTGDEGAARPGGAAGYDSTTRHDGTAALDGLGLERTVPGYDG